MSFDVEQYVTYKIANAPELSYPYPHLYVCSIFPDEYYQDIWENLPATDAYVSLANSGRVSTGKYGQRFVLPLNDETIEKLSERQRAFWSHFANWICGGKFLTTVLDRFRLTIEERFAECALHLEVKPEALLVRDFTNYEIGPHTDAPHRLVSLLFYLPPDDRNAHLGTSIYVPIAENFTCDGGPHYTSESFLQVATMPFKANSLFAFPKTNRAFHGVEKIRDEAIVRDLLLYNIRIIHAVGGTE